MRLKNIQLSGFKSFADVTTVPIHTQLTAVVGPNGCGKSNIVDAVRCVLSSAAKHLRGDTIPDVIFNGSANRKPVGQAAVGLTFDNSDGSLGGEYAAYPEIYVRREINRDGTSNYYLNNTRCRRRDVVDIFLGTGLGPQSYAIIEQGMISRLIEAKPDDMRVYLEEAAGISRYKERRRETENRMQHTRENLERLTDHRLEIDKQLAHLKRQASAAERYKELKQEERLLKAQLQALNWSWLDQEIKQHNHLIQEAETQLEAKIAEQRKIDAQIEQLRHEKTQYTDTFNQAQSRYYSMGAEIARLEQHVKSIKERKQQLQNDIAQVEKNSAQLQQEYEQDEQQAEDLNTDLIKFESDFQEATVVNQSAQQKFQQAQQGMNHWQLKWDEFNQQANKAVSEVQIQQARIQHLQQTMETIRQRIEKLTQEREQFNFQKEESEINSFNEKSQSYKNQLDVIQARTQYTSDELIKQRQLFSKLTQELDSERSQLQTLRGRFSSLEALQQAALHKNDQIVQNWLAQQQMQNNPRLAENIHVESGWELAVETVLGFYLEAVCVDDFLSVAKTIGGLEKSNITLFRTSDASASGESKNSRPILASKVTTQWPIAALQNIYIAEDLTQALELRTSLETYESVITRDGFWVGYDWIHVAKQEDNRGGVIQRERELKEMQKSIVTQEEMVLAKNKQVEEIKLHLDRLEIERETAQQQYRELTDSYGEAQAQLSGKQMRLEQLYQREQVVNQELIENQKHNENSQMELEALKEQWQQASKKMLENEEQKKELLLQRESCQTQLAVSRDAAAVSKQNVDELQVRLESTRSHLHYLRQSMQRAKRQLEEMMAQKETLTRTLAEASSPLDDLTNQLEQALTNRLSIERELEAERQKLNQAEHALNEEESNLHLVLEQNQEIRHELEQLRMKLQALSIHQGNHVEKIKELEMELTDLLQQMPQDAEKNAWEEKITHIENRIQRLGLINLAAIDEYNQLAERKTYLDAQNEDLFKALAMLEEAIRKIDRETRIRLKETYEKVNENFNRLFQQIFKGGNASLELSDEDWLSSGIIVKAQPPGKRNTTIHLLSGGEKALTASALVFALFELNPAPFCILDEVDAPLDDVNVDRFCNLLREMSKKVQFIFISHNKLSIAAAEQLIGVTMNEPGVSRLVSVDIDQAIAMATA